MEPWILDPHCRAPVPPPGIKISLRLEMFSVRDPYAPETSCLLELHFRAPLVDQDTTYIRFLLRRLTLYSGRWISKILHHFFKCTAPRAPSLNIVPNTCGVTLFFFSELVRLNIKRGGEGGTASTSLDKWCRILLFHCLQVSENTPNGSNVTAPRTLPHSFVIDHQE